MNEKPRGTWSIIVECALRRVTSGPEEQGASNHYLGQHAWKSQIQLHGEGAEFCK